MLDTFKVLTCAATYHEFLELQYLESSWLCISWEIIETQALHLNQSISKMLTRTKRKWIFGEASALKEGFDQHMGGHISLHGHDFYEISDNYKNENKNNGSSEFITFYNIRNPFNPHLYYTIIPCFSICSKPHRTRMCSILLFLHNLLPQDHHQKRFSQDFKHQLLSQCPFAFFSIPSSRSPKKFMSVQERRPFIKHWD